MVARSAIAGIGKSIGEEAVGVAQEGKKVLVESAQDALDTMLWALTFGLFSVAFKSEMDHNNTFISQNDSNVHEEPTNLLTNLAQKDRQTTNSQIKRYKDIIAEEIEVHAETEKQKDDWKKRVEKEMHGETNISESPPPTDLSDVGSIQKNPGLFARTSKEKDRKKGM